VVGVVVEWIGSVFVVSIHEKYPVFPVRKYPVLLAGAVVGMLNINNTLSTSTGNVLGKLLLQGKGLEGGLDDVHGIARAPDFGADIQNTDARANLVNVVVATVTETCLNKEHKYVRSRP
jgi:hypothetical protein